MKRTKNTKAYLILGWIILCGCFCSCEKMLMDEGESDDAVVNFDYLWQRVDRQYALFDVKSVDWQRVHDTLRPQVHNGMSHEALFRVMAKMLNTLEDGHVNLITPFDVARSDSVWYRRVARSNIDEATVNLHYLGIGYHTTGSLRHNVIADSSVIYIRYSSFENAVNESQIHYISRQYPKAKGMIIDVRQNGGGAIRYIWELLKAMPSHGQTLYTTQIKSGPRHQDFGAATAVVAPSGEYAPYRHPVVVLTDRGSYSATSLFAISTMAYDDIYLMGDTTGGGLGLPNGGELPNGWRYRFSTTRTLAVDGKNYENGVPPDYTVILDPTATAIGRDNVIDSAVSLIKILNGEI